jgi:hypothetical protein
MARTLFAAALWLSSSTTAVAMCDAPYTRAEVVADIGVLTVSLRDLELDAFDVAAQRMEANLVCIRETLPPLVFASAYRYIGTYHYFQGDTPTAESWLRTALEIDPGFAWDVSQLGEEHPLRTVMAKARVEAQSSPVAVEGMQLNIPSGSSLLLDGRPLTLPEATQDRPHLVQVVSTADGTIRQVDLIQGNTLPGRLLAKAGSTAPLDPEDLSPSPLAEEDLFKVTKVQRVRPKAKTPLMLAGGATGLAAGGLYMMSNRYRDDFQSATTTMDLEQAAKMTNLMVVASGLTLAAGLSVEFAGMRLGFSGSGVQLGRPL